jgi:sugar O-acyltransferase (sialic acid O-acetyltransferase NeuD family)
MLIIGAKGHASEILEILTLQNELEDLFFFDNVSQNISGLLYDKFKVVRTYEEASDLFKTDDRFILGVGSPGPRYELSQKFIKLGGILTSIISPNANVGRWNCVIQAGVNIMQKALISNDTFIGEGTLVNAGCNIHHGCRIGIYAEISPLAGIGGNCEIGDFSSIGFGATILPNIKIGRNVVVGAGAVVTKNIDNNLIVTGMPAEVADR